MRNVLAQMSHKDKKQVAEVIKLVFEQPDQVSAKAFLESVAQLMESRWPKVPRKLLETEDDILAYKSFPKKHHRSIHAVNPLERINREIRGWTRVVGAFPNRASVLRLLGTRLMDIDENWRGGRRYMAQEGINKQLNPELEEPPEQSFKLVDKLLNLEAQNSIYTT